jgi:hypothetical protein
LIRGAYTSFHVAVQQRNLRKQRGTVSLTSTIGDHHVPFTPEQVTAAQKANLETLFGLTNKAFEGVEKLVELNLQVAKAALAEAAETTQAACRSRTRRNCWPCKPACCNRPPRRPPPTAATCTTSLAGTNAEVTKAAEATMADAQKKFWPWSTPPSRTPRPAPRTPWRW